MAYVPFYEYFPEIAAIETRCLMSINNPALPPGEYGLVEAFCDELGCDCRRVFLNVISREQGGLQAVIAFGWEEETFYAKWMGSHDPSFVKGLKGPSFNPLSLQSKLAPILLEYVKKILQDRDYVERIKKHYWQFREKIELKNTPSLSTTQTSDLVVLAVKERAMRCRILQTGERITFRPLHSPLFEAVPGEVITIRSQKYWKYGKTVYVSGKIVSSRLDIPVLNITPLGLKEQGLWDPQEKNWGEPDSPIDPHFVSLIQAGPRPSFEMEQVIPGEDPDNPYTDPILEASEYFGCDDDRNAYKIMEKILVEDLRCLDAHAHLGNWAFELARFPDQVEMAKRHHEVGIRIGELSLGDNFKGVLLWGHINNRPFLRCLHGYGLSLWRLGQNSAARYTFERMLWLNPPDNQGARFLLSDLDRGLSWEEFQEKEDVLLSSAEQGGNRP